jgi:hypothetical protein
MCAFGLSLARSHAVAEEANAVSWVTLLLAC